MNQFKWANQISPTHFILSVQLYAHSHKQTKWGKSLSPDFVFLFTFVFYQIINRYHWVRSQINANNVLLAFAQIISLSFFYHIIYGYNWLRSKRNANHLLFAQIIILVVMRNTHYYDNYHSVLDQSSFIYYLE